MLDPAPSGEPLHITITIARRSSEGIGMVQSTSSHNRHSLKAAMRVRGKSRHSATVVHVEAIFEIEISTQLTSAEILGRPERIIAARIFVVVMDSEQERVSCLPWPT